MNLVVKQMLAQYDCHGQDDYIHALKEIIQEIALLGLWRAKFHEKAAFYGGSALRILYGLDRFSEDLDFTLLHKDNNFQLDSYNQAIEKELKGFGFEVTVEKKTKSKQSAIESAFIKANSKMQLLHIEAPVHVTDKLHSMHTIKIKMKVDIHPPGKFSTESKTLLQPIPFSVNTVVLPDLFAGKIHAILCRPWVKRVKGRDWYDFVWYVSRGHAVNLVHLQERLVQSGAYQPGDKLTLVQLQQLLIAKIETTDFANARVDVALFIKDQHVLALWSTAFFTDLVHRLKAIND